MASRGGRPSFKPTKPQRDRVMRLRADGWSKERIARIIGIDVGTLIKHFAEELEHGADIKTDALLEYAEKGAKKGSSANIKWLSERYALARAAEQVDQRASQPPSEAEIETRKAPPRGKKEMLQSEAEGVSGIFAPPAPPKVH